MTQLNSSSRIGGRRFLLVLGGVYVALTAIYPFLPTVDETPLGTDVVMAVLVGVPGFVLLAGGYWLPRSNIRAEVFSVIASWCLGGIGVMLALLALVALAAGLRDPVQNVLILTALGSVAGFAAGAHNARAKTRELELEETIEELQRSNERLEQFAYAASHDLQEPLRMISTYLQLVERRADDELSDETAEYLEYAVDGADRMREMIRALLEYSRVDSRGRSLEPVDLTTVFEDVCEEMQGTFEEADAEITADSLPRVECDADQLEQVFRNLLENAIVYSGDEPPRIAVSAERNGTTCEISIRDEGIGIHPDDQARIFDVFERLHTHEEYPGSGVGLAICERIIERHDGEIRVESAPGEGSTFSFTLPTATGDETRSETPTAD